MVGPSRRVRLVNQNELMIFIGQLIAYSANAIPAHFAHIPSVWRYMLVIAIVPAALLWIGMHFVPKSPRWLAAEGRFDEAREILCRIRARKVQVETEVKEIIRQNEVKRAQPGLSGIFGEPWTRNPAHGRKRIHVSHPYHPQVDGAEHKQMLRSPPRPATG